MYNVHIPSDINKKLEFIKNLPQHIENYRNEKLLEIAEEIQKRLTDKIEEGDSDWQALSEPYKAYKKRNKLDPRMWRATGQMQKSIKIIPQVRKGLLLGYTIGIPGRKKYKAKKGSTIKGPNMSYIARTLEYGSPTRNIPPRPLFGTVEREMLKDIRTKLRLYRAGLANHLFMSLHKRKVAKTMKTKLESKRKQLS